MSRVSPLCAAFCPDSECVCGAAEKANVRKKYKIAIQQRDCDFERRRSEMDELSRFARK